jgi:hypothetical protein
VGDFQVAIRAKSKKVIKIDAEIKAGENYVYFSPSTKKLIWNDKEYITTIDNTFIVNE